LRVEEIGDHEPQPVARPLKSESLFLHFSLVAPHPHPHADHIIGLLSPQYLEKEFTRKELYAAIADGDDLARMQREAGNIPRRIAHASPRSGKLHFGPQGASCVLDHLQPVSKGGDNSYENLATACLQCNSQRGSQPLMDHLTRKQDVQK
jgi:5-methylcytosine-specific restriction endonuclease McrA